ncbi:acylphosphatase [Lactococcus termiticola]|uniref:acylphosphatase n=1 Tax=Lactococcus termiticola TaxID=2169526 RepID=A0A2R5HJW1_9LACT|nr:acylphosphatase [Lactococcus termiticola]GBG96980.1 acylphosphatase [Lactococcus termiticola]
MQKLKIIVSGRVQGVGFRFGCIQLAQQYGIYGRVWNNPDGTVGILAQAEDAVALQSFVTAVRKGPTPFAKVTYLEAIADNSELFSDFKIV